MKPTKVLRLCLFFLPLLPVSAAVQATDATPADVYAQAVRIEAEVETLKRHFKIAGKAKVATKSGDIKPRHNWAKSYTLQYKLGKLRRKFDLPYVEPTSIEPLLEIHPTQPWAMTQRILTEIAIIKAYLDIPGQAPPMVPVSGKRPIDVFNKLHQISGDLDLLTDPPTPSDVYGQVKRLNEDVNLLLRHLGLLENAVPPPRRDNLQSKDSLAAVFAVMAEIQRVQRSYGLATTDFKGFDMGDRTTPDDVFGFVQQALIELQRVKAQVGLNRAITPGAPYEENKTPSDVVQLLGYVTAKLSGIRPQ